MGSDATPAGAVDLQIVAGKASGYCDPVTGMCVLPDASNQISAEADAVNEPVAGEATPTAQPG